VKFWLILTVSSNFWQDFSRFLQQLKKIDKDANFDEWAKVLELCPFHTLYLQLRLLSIFFDHLCCSIRSYIWVNWRVAIILFRHTKFEKTITAYSSCWSRSFLTNNIDQFDKKYEHMENTGCPQKFSEKFKKLLFKVRQLSKKQKCDLKKKIL
jgi:hypothetical protein